jgi:hypothetical protein
LTEADEFDDFGVFDDELTVEMGPDSLGGSSHVRSRDEALGGNLPTLLIHRGSQHFKQIPDVVNQLHGTKSASLNLGIVLNLPRVKPELAQTWLSSRCAASVRIADPELFTRPDMWGPALLLERDGPPRQDEPIKPLMPQTTTPLWDYWTRELPSGPTSAWVADVVDAQRQAGANLILTPGLPLDQHAPVLALDQLMEQVGWARDTLQSGERLAVNVTIESPWLATSALRTRLLNSVVESDEDVWYIRVKWPLQPSYAELIDGALLDGYREISAVMEDDERILLLPTSGGTGWVSLAWGAAGFGTGIGSGARGLVTTRPVRIKGPRGAVSPRYYERPLLHSVEKTTADALARIPGYAACSCIYCLELRERPSWSNELHGAHYLLAMGEQVAALAGGSGRRGVARRMVRDALRTRDRVIGKVPLTDRDSPAHLAMWRERLL